LTERAESSGSPSSSCSHRATSRVVIAAAGRPPKRDMIRARGDGHLVVTIPETIETTADDLAPALAAV
jgi:hypothetical protein